MKHYGLFSLFFFFKDTAPTEISPLPLHAALPICRVERREDPAHGGVLARIALGIADDRLGRLLGLGLAPAQPHSGGSPPNARRHITVATRWVAMLARAPSPASRPDHISRLTRSPSTAAAVNQTGAASSPPHTVSTTNRFACS